MTTGNAPNRIRILIADDHPVVREGIAAMFVHQVDMEVVGSASNGIEAIEKTRELRPDVILMDLRMPALDGVEAMKRIRSENPDVKLIVLTTYDTTDLVVSAIKAGAQAYLLKDAPRDDIFRAIRAVCEGKSVIEPAVASKVIQQLSQPARLSAAEILSTRELEVLRLMARGDANKEIALTLGISESTVKTHVQSIFQKLEANSRTEAVARAVALGIISL